MKSFLKMFLAALLAMVAFTILVFFVLAGMIGSAVSTTEKVSLAPNSLLVIDLSQPLMEQKNINPFNVLLQHDRLETNGLHDVITLIGKAATDDRVKGIYLKINDDPNGFATNEALRKALLDFKRSKKFIYAYGDVVSQKAYYVATVADKIFLNPQGMLDFSGFSMQMMFLKGTLDKLEIEPQIFYDGKFKSATEPLRTTQMTEANRIQTKAFLGDLYNHFLAGVSRNRNIDTARLFRYANEGLIQDANDALRYGLVDGLKYNDEMMDMFREQLGISSSADLHLVSVNTYEKSGDAKDYGIGNKVAVLYAQGDIVTGDGSNDGNDIRIASGDYIKMIRKLRKDSSVKAIVFRVNSPGGSALASDEIWRELLLAKKRKPVVVSMGDYAASGGYYISCVADSIFAEPNTLTGSIGVFGIIPNLQSFFKNKLGITFDGVKTAQYADLGTVSRPLTETEKRFIQRSVDSTYATFKRRVAAGRHLSEAAVDSIAQGRVWSGVAAREIGLVDRLGGLNDAIACAARMAHLPSYNLREYPEPEAPFRKLFKNLSGGWETAVLKKELGENFPLYHQWKMATGSNGTIMARLPYELIVR